MKPLFIFITLYLFIASCSPTIKEPIQRRCGCARGVGIKDTNPQSRSKVFFKKAKDTNSLKEIVIPCFETKF